MFNNDFKDVVFNRHSIKEFDTNVKISHEEMLQMIKEATTAPSSVNMQPWRFVVVESPEGKAKLRPLVRMNTRQNDSSAAMILIFGDMRCYEKAEQIYSDNVRKGYMPEEIKKELMDAFMPEFKKASRAKMNDLVKIDASLAAMQLMLVARAHGYDTNAIGGFEDDLLAEAFGIDKERYIPVMILAIGKADGVAFSTTRLDPEEITIFK